MAPEQGRALDHHLTTPARTCEDDGHDWKYCGHDDEGHTYYKCRRCGQESEE